MVRAPDAGWDLIQRLLPPGWESKAYELKAFQRSRYITQPGTVLRMLLFHAISDSGLRLSTEQLRLAGIVDVSATSLLYRMRTAAPWLGWIASQLCRSLWTLPSVFPGKRLRAIDSTTIQSPRSSGTDWRLHYSLTLPSLTCDWFLLTDAKQAERLTRVPVRAGDVILADRYYLTARGADDVRRRQGALIVRLRWSHPIMHDASGRRFRALSHATHLKVGAVGEWPVRLHVPGGAAIDGRVIVIRLSAQKALKNKRRLKRRASRRGTRTDPRTWRATHFVMLFTTVPARELSSQQVGELYRFRWQIELAFKRLKQLLSLGHVMYKEPRAVRTWILAKLVVALLMEKVRSECSHASFRGRTC